LAGADTLGAGIGKIGSSGDAAGWPVPTAAGAADARNHQIAAEAGRKFLATPSPPSSGPECAPEGNPGNALPFPQHANGGPDFIGEPREMNHVLAVDDDPAMRQMISDYLSDRDLRVSTAADSREMTSIIDENIVDLVILDLKLASEDGLKLLHELRARSNLPVIVLTGHRRDEVDRVVGLELGADDYLTKPFSPRELLARIRAVL